ncbi:MAG: hypothetical protein HY951_00350 [Bacteroidia bacterium]|nr:hypothetical protein [Bacteroidia bacterium]
MGYKINWEKRGVFVEFKDNSTGKDVINIDNILYSYDKFEKMKYQLWDFTESKENVFSDEEMEIIGILDKSASIWNKSMLVAIVSNDSVFIESLEIYKKEISEIGWICEVFKDLKSARDWLNSRITS